MKSRSLLVSLVVRVALIPLDRPGLTLVVALGVAISAGAVFVAGVLR